MSETSPNGIRPSTPSRAELDHLVGGDHSQPHSVLGAHPAGAGRTAIRALRPDADSVQVVIKAKRYPLERLHPSGVFGAVLDVEPTDYRLEVSYGEHTVIVDDPYRWLPTLGELDLHLIGEGRHEQLWDVLGAHVRSYDTADGTAHRHRRSRSGRRTPAACGWSATSTTGTAPRSRCARSARPGCGSCSCPASATARTTSSRSSAPTRSGGTRPTRWPSPPRCRRPPRRSCSPPTTTGRTPTGWPRGPARPGTRRRCRSTRCTWAPGGRA